MLNLKNSFMAVVLVISAAHSYAADCKLTWIQKGHGEDSISVPVGKDSTMYRTQDRRFHIQIDAPKSDISHYHISSSEQEVELEGSIQIKGGYVSWKVNELETLDLNCK